MIRGRPKVTPVGSGRDDLARVIGMTAKTARVEAGWTQEEVARRVGLVTQVYGRLERGDMRPSIETFRQLVLVLKVSPDDLLGIHQRASADARRSRKRESRPLVQQLVHQCRELDARTLRIVLGVARALAPRNRRKRGRR